MTTGETGNDLMDSLNPQTPPPLIVSEARPPKIWKFWGTALWGVFIFAAMFAGQLAVFGYLMLAAARIPSTFPP